MTQGLGLYVLSAHFAADYLFQPDSWAKEKTENGGALIAHAVQYTAVMMVVAPLLAGPLIEYVAFATLVAVPHAIVDDRRWFEERPHFESRPYVLDQVVHLIHLAGVVFFFTVVL